MSLSDSLEVISRPDRGVEVGVRFRNNIYYRNKFSEKFNRGFRHDVGKADRETYADEVVILIPAVRVVRLLQLQPGAYAVIKEYLPLIPLGFGIAKGLIR